MSSLKRKMEAVLDGSKKYKKGPARPTKATGRFATKGSAKQQNYGVPSNRAPARLTSRGRLDASELKCVDTSWTAVGTLGSAGHKLPINANGFITQLNTGPQEGASFYNRIGRRIKGVSMEIRGHISPTTGNIVICPKQYARILIVYDRQPNGNTAALSDILNDYYTNGTQGTGVYSSMNMNNRDRFQILRDRKFVLPQTPIVSSTLMTYTTQPDIQNDDLADSLYNYHEYIKLGGLESHYQATANGLIGDVATGAYLILLISEFENPATLSESSWQLGCDVRFKFYD